MPVPVVSVIDQLSAAMSVSSLQNRVIASNIANRSSEGYHRLQLRFTNAMDRMGGVEITADHSATHVSLEEDLVALSSNAGRYGTMARVLSRYFSMVSIIATPGST